MEDSDDEEEETIAHALKRKKREKEADENLKTARERVDEERKQKAAQDDLI